MFCKLFLYSPNMTAGMHWTPVQTGCRQDSGESNIKLKMIGVIKLLQQGTDREQTSETS